MAYRAFAGIDPRLLEKREFVDPSKALEAAGDAVSKIGSTIADGIDKRSKAEKEQEMYNLKKNALLDEQAERDQEFESTISDINEFIKKQNESDDDPSNDVDSLDISVPKAPEEVDPTLKGKEKRQAKKGYAAKQAQYKKDLNKYYETRYTQLGDFAKKNKIPVSDLNDILTASKNATEFGQTVVAKGAAKYYSTNGNPLDAKAKAKQRAVLSNPDSIKAVPGSDGVVRLYAVDPGAEGVEGGVIQLGVYRDGMTIDEVLGGDKTSSNLGRIDSFALEQLPTESEALTKGDFSGIETIKARIADRYTDSDVNESIFESFIRTAGINLEGFKFDGILTDDEKALLKERDPGLFKYIVDEEIDGYEVANLYEIKKKAQYKDQIAEFDTNKALDLEKKKVDIRHKEAQINAENRKNRGGKTLTEKQRESINNEQLWKYVTSGEGTWADLHGAGNIGQIIIQDGQAFILPKGKTLDQDDPLKTLIPATDQAVRNHLGLGVEQQPESVEFDATPFIQEGTEFIDTSKLPSDTNQRVSTIKSLKDAGYKLPKSPTVKGFSETAPEATSQESQSDVLPEIKKGEKGYNDYKTAMKHKNKIDFAVSQGKEPAQYDINQYEHFAGRVDKVINSAKYEIPKVEKKLELAKKDLDKAQQKVDYAKSKGNTPNKYLKSQLKLYTDKVADLESELDKLNKK